MSAAQGQKDIDLRPRWEAAILAVVLWVSIVVPLYMFYTAPWPDEAAVVTYDPATQGRNVSFELEKGDYEVWADRPHGDVGQVSITGPDGATVFDGAPDEDSSHKERSSDGFYAVYLGGFHTESGEHRLDYTEKTAGAGERIYVTDPIHPNVGLIVGWIVGGAVGGFVCMIFGSLLLNWRDAREGKDDG